MLGYPTSLLFLLLRVVDGTSRPGHVMIMLVDDLGYGDVGYAGAEYPTPTIDRLASQGVVLNQSYVMQLCSPTRTSLLTGRYSYNIGTDGNVLTRKEERCADLRVNTIADVLKAKGAATAMVGKWDAGDSSWACTPTCRGFDYYFGYWGAAEDYYLHGSAKFLDLHENMEHAPQYRGEYSTQLFTRMAGQWLKDTVTKHPQTPTFLWFAHQAVHGPLEAPTQYFAKCNHIKEQNRRTYCAMMQALDESVANITQVYQDLGIWDDTLLVFLADNGGRPQEGGFNMPLRGGKATVWEGGVRSQTFVHWPRLASERVGETFGGLVHVSDWLPTVLSALFGTTAPAQGLPLDGVDVWPAIRDGKQSPRTEMLLSLRDADVCSAPEQKSGCADRGQAAYRSGRYKIISGHTSLRGAEGDDCSWDSSAAPKRELTCDNGWAKPFDLGTSRSPNPVVNPPPALPKGRSAYSFGSVWLFDIESDPLEEKDLSAAMPKKVAELLAKIAAFNATQIDQSVNKDSRAVDYESCGDGLQCVVPWLKPSGSDQCSPPSPSPPSPSPPPVPPAPPPSPGSCGQIQREARCKNQPDYAKHPVTTYTQCCDMCRADPNCRVWTFFATVSVCKLKNQDCTTGVTGGKPGDVLGLMNNATSVISI